MGGDFVDGDAWVEALGNLATVLGLRLRTLARFSRLESEDSDSSSSEIASGDWPFLAVLERVMGAK